GFGDCYDLCHRQTISRRPDLAMVWPTRETARTCNPSVAAHLLGYRTGHIVLNIRQQLQDRVTSPIAIPRLDPEKKLLVQCEPVVSTSYPPSVNVRRDRSVWTYLLKTTRVDP